MFLIFLCNKIAQYIKNKKKIQMIHFSDTEIDAFLAEDVPYFDLTAELLDIPGKANISFAARENGVICGTEEAAKICKKLSLETNIHIPSGGKSNSGDTILTASGDAKAVLKAWKPSQNILEYASAVATQTAKMVEAIKAVSPHTHFATTRKTIPNTKKLAIKAVLCGGGYAHRLGLSESVLIFAQYAALAGMSLEGCIQKAKEQTMEHKIAVEVKNKPDAIAAAKAGADIVQCDKLEIDELRGTVAAVKSVDSRITIIATGGINLQNAASYAAVKPDIIVSSSVYYSKPFDVKVTIEPA